MSYEGVAYKHFSSWIEKSSTPDEHRLFWSPDRSPAQQPTLGRHGPRRDANRVQCLFLLLLSLEESNQRTLRNLNARCTLHPACRKFRWSEGEAVSSRATRSPKLYPFECICPPHTAEDFAGAGLPVASRVGVVGRASVRHACSRTCRRHVRQQLCSRVSLFVPFVQVRGKQNARRRSR
jgi:hypothetical protein